MELLKNSLKVKENQWKIFLLEAFEIDVFFRVIDFVNHEHVVFLVLDPLLNLLYIYF